MRCFGILVENQKVRVKWNANNKKHFESYGYIFTNKGDEFEVNVEELMHSSKTKVMVRCDYCGALFSKDYGNYTKEIMKINKCSCNQCKSKKIQDIQIKKYSSSIIEKFQEYCKRHDYIPITTEETYCGCNNLKYKCKLHGIRRINTGAIIKDHICKECARKKMGHKVYSAKDVLKVIEEENGNTLLNPNEYKNVVEKNLKVVCGRCGNTYTTSFSLTRNYKNYCPLCTPKKREELPTRLNKNVLEKYINSINHNVLLNKDDYVNANQSNLKILCGTCKKNIFTTSYSMYKFSKVIRCKRCSSAISKKEYEIMGYLENHHINYEYNKRFEECRYKQPLPFDFYIESCNCCIEYDGVQHYEPVEAFGGIEHLKLVQKRDAIKNQYCINNNIKLIRIPYFYGNQIEKILDEDLLGITNNKPIKMIPKYGGIE